MKFSCYNHKHRRKKMRNLAISIIVLSLCSCITKEYKGGVPIRQSQYSEIRNATTKQDVYKILGSPAAQNFVGDEKWYYYTSEGEAFAFLDPKFSKYEVLVIGFDSNDKIKDIKLKNLANKELVYNKKVKTELPSDIKLGFFEELFGNIGKFTNSGLSGN